MATFTVTVTMAPPPAKPHVSSIAGSAHLKEGAHRDRRHLR
jgi:hypothetical protein